MSMVTAPSCVVLRRAPSPAERAWRDRQIVQMFHAEHLQIWEISEALKVSERMVMAVLVAAALPKSRDAIRASYRAISTHRGEVKALRRTVEGLLNESMSPTEEFRARLLARQLLGRIP